MNILIFAAHPDDETFGMGGTIKKLSKKNTVHLCVVTEGTSAQYIDPKMIKKRKDACIKAGKILGISTFDFLNYSDMKLDSVPSLNINKDLEKIVKKYKPEIVYTTPKNDLNKDHQIVFESTLVATRPNSTSVKHLFSYEIPGITKSPFFPTIYEDINKQFSTKIKACKSFSSEIQKFPNPRSIEFLESLAIKRGVESGLKKAESFELIRSIFN